MALLCKESADFRHKSLNYGIFQLQKYTFSPKLQIIGEEIHFNGPHFFKNTNDTNETNERKCQQIQYDIPPCVNSFRKLPLLHSVSLLLRLTTRVPYIRYLYTILNNTVNNLIQTIHNNAAIRK